MTLLTRAASDVGPGLTGLAGPLLPGLLAALFGPISATDAAVEPATLARGVPLFDLAATPFPRWVAQMGGVNPAPSLTDAQVRVLAAGATAATKGTLAGLRAAVQATLTGSREVQVTERVGGDAYAVAVQTYAAETTNPAASAAAARAALPVGIVLTFTVAAGWTWEEYRAEAPITWDAATASGMTWEQFGSTVPND